MADETELNELRERIARLNAGDQMRLLECALADNRQKRAETQAELLAMHEEYLAHEQRQRALADAPPALETKRAAG